MPSQTSDNVRIELLELLRLDSLNERLHERALPIRAYTTDPDCGVAIDEIVGWIERYPGIVVAEELSPAAYVIAPAAVPDGATLVIAGYQSGLTARGDPLIAAGMYLVHGPPPPCVPQMYRRARPKSSSPLPGR